MNSRDLSRVATAAWSVLLVAAFVMPPFALAIAVWASPQNLSSLPSKPVALTAPVQLVSDSENVPVAVKLSWKLGAQLVSPQWSGLVTSLGVSAGSDITNGTVVGIVAGLKRLAVSSPSPFYRPVGPGVTGPDVAELRSALASLGYGGLGNSDAYDTSLAVAIRRLYSNLSGLTSGSGGVFQPAWFVWLPVSSLVAGKVDLVIGTPAPAVGSPIVVGAETLTSAAIQPASGPSPVPLPASPISHVLSVPGVPEPLALTAGFVVTIDELPSLDRAATPGQPVLSGTLSLAHPATFASVPNSAVVVGANGTACVWAPGAGHYKSYKVTTRSGLPGTTEVYGLPSPVTSVLANPAQILASAGACP